jgi:predicted P-loop ATPase
MRLPEHAGVANAVGAVVGRVTFRRSGTVTSPAEGKYRVHLENGPQDFPDSEQAMSVLEQTLTQQVEGEAKTAGAEDIRSIVERDIRSARLEARDVFVEAIVTVEASGRPRVALG